MTFRVLTAEFAHETNIFSRLLTGKQAFRDRYVLMGDDAIAARGEANTELAGFLDAGRAHGWHLEHVVSAAAVILAHNHPSDVSEPSLADQAITCLLKDALLLLEIRLLDHFVVGDGPPVSMASRGML